MKRNSSKHSISFLNNNHIVQNGAVVGHIDGSYVLLYKDDVRARAAEFAAAHNGFPGYHHDATVIGRWKYGGKASAKHFLKWALARYSVDEVIAKTQQQDIGSGIGWAIDEGYVSPAMRRAEKLRKERERRQNTVWTEVVLG